MIVYVFGNPDLAEDALPLRLVPALRTRFPEITFEMKDPNEEWDAPEHLTVIDTVVGIDQVRIFDGVEIFSRAPRVSMHDYDALTQLRLLMKLGKLKAVTVIGIPPSMDEHKALDAVIAELLRGTSERGIVDTSSVH